MKGQGSRRWCTALSLLTMVFLVGISLTNGWVAGVALAAHPALSGAELSIGFNGGYGSSSQVCRFKRRTIGSQPFALRVG